MDIDQISLALTEYRDGDLLGLSELIDTLAPLEAASQVHPIAETYCHGLLTHLGLAMRGGTALRRDFLAETLDHLRFILRQDQDQLPGLVDDLAGIQGEWRTRFAVCLVDPTVNPAETNKSAKTPAQPSAIDPIPAAASPGATPAENPFAREEIFKVFLMDARERLVSAQELCIQLENQPDNDQAGQELFRIFHTFKGECGFFKLATIGDLAHAYENLLDLVRQHTISVNSVMVDLFLQGIDRFRILIDALDSRDMVLHNDIEIDDIKNAIEAIQIKTKQPIGEKLVAAGMITEEEKNLILQRQKDQSFTKSFGDVAVEKHLLTHQEIEAVAQASSLPGSGSAPTADQYIKVQASQINYLVDMVGELVIAQNQVDSHDPALLMLRKITKEIQLAALKLRTTKLRAVTLSVHRALRDVAQKLGKTINFVSRGEDLEIDRNLVEGLSEPLLHMVRNAAHHGIESGADRLSTGKTAEGTVILDSQRQGNSIVISIEDDGKGLDRQAILAKALEQNLISADQIASISDKETWDLIFRPGFSTASAVDQISGRGVGMDIVRAFVMANRGRIEIQTQPGAFTRIMLFFPISTAIIDGMIATVGDLTIIIPVNQVVESLNYATIERFQVGGNRVEVINLRGAIIPVINLAGYFQVESQLAGQRIGVVVEDSFQKRFVFLVDSIIGKREVVVKPLGSRFKNLKAINSGTVLAGGKIGYIIDAEFIIQESGAAAGAQE